MLDDRRRPGTPAEVAVRPFRRPDAARTAALVRSLFPSVVVSEDGLLHWVTSEPARAHGRWWVAVRRRDIIGFGHAALRTWRGRPVGAVWAGVRPDARDDGVEDVLLDAAETHATGHGAVALETVVRANDRAAFALRRGRGYRRTGASHTLTVNPASVDLSDMPRREAAARFAGFRLAPLREVIDRPRDLYALFVAIARDMPSDDATAPRFAEWRRQILASPLLHPDGSFVVVAGDDLAAMAWLNVDPVSRQASNELTGTVALHRGRGLASLAKRAAIRWAAADGIRRIHTDTDQSSAEMLAINEHLGYRPTTGYLLLRRRA